MDGNRRIADAQGVNVGLPAHSRRGAEGCRRSQFDPFRKFGMVLASSPVRNHSPLSTARYLASPIEKAGKMMSAQIVDAN